METLEHWLEYSIGVITLLVEFTAVLCVVVGFFSALLYLIRSKEEHYSPMFNRLKLRFGGWLALALEFQLASDILQTTVSPSYENLIQLGAIALIRTFLNYFLSKELGELPELIDKNLRKSSKSNESKAES
ncbi:MAG: DUF1622 domain-containing protein [Algoriphagus sp.]|nr:DUF1622 domain-containing protein [Algoriphagus sp.]